MDRRLVAACAATAVLLLPLAWFWQQSLLPSTYSVTDMGYVDVGGGPPLAHAAAHGAHGDAGDGPPGGLSVTDLTGPRSGTPDVAVDLVARAEQVRLAGGDTLDGFTLNGSTPGPLIEARRGDLVQVRVRNESVPGGLTLHWHGVDVPNAEDGVAGVTQDAVRPGEEHVYRFVADQVGTYWYHSHQDSHEQVRGGLYGVLLVRPDTPASGARDVVAAVHTYAGTRTVNGVPGEQRLAARSGEAVRVRVVNTDSLPLRAWVAGASYRVAAVDGTDVHEPGEAADATVLVTAGGRVDLAFTVPADGSAVRVGLGGGTSLVLGPENGRAPGRRAPTAQLDLLSYGSPAPLGFDPAAADRSFEYRIGRRPGFLAGRPGMWWTVNGHLYPDIPMFMVAEGDVVRMHLQNDTNETHPMHLHGHHAVVLSRDGVKATGSPWWVDSLDVARGESYEIAFVADNPGVWMDHCHNLPHAVEGLVAHLMYDGVTTPFRVGGPADNRPE
jgi:FtsP/CotA-like multicopper oxidase with cupredoxin domain